MLLTNQTIYEYAQKLTTFTLADLIIPVRINFFLQRNIKTIVELGREIEQLRLKIAQQYGAPTDNGFSIPNENQAIVQQELSALFTLEQDVPLHVFTLSEIETLNLTWDQLSAILFMIIPEDEPWGGDNDLSTSD